MADATHQILAELETAFDNISSSPTDDGVVELIVRRPKTNLREVLQEAELDLVEGLIGDKWKPRGKHTDSDDAQRLDDQLTLMNARVVEFIAQDKERWPLAGDQLYLDFDLSAANLPPGTQLAIGTAIIEITPLPHTGCHKFANRFGRDAVKFINSAERRHLQLRGVHAKVIHAGVVRVGDPVTKLSLNEKIASHDGSD